MALARLALKQLQQRVGSASALASSSPLVETRPIGSAQQLLPRSFSTEKGKSDKSSEVTVSEGKKSRLFPRRQRRRWPWRNDDRDFPPALTEFFPSGLGNALMQATENINRLFDNMNITPWSVSGRVREKDDHYKLRYEMPGIPKEDVKITIDDGVLTIRGEHREQNQEEEDDEYWSSSSYGYYNTSLVLPDDAKADEVKAELKDGVLTVTIPRTEKTSKDVKQISVQ
ncbi:26.5 kDa heat shock protein, mitochondrial-like [Neltuma alba]|uniref:26.5 kDa heat shock protein, mitochondrial-like n=1 Tax=Neltuma alba TaxID=207710 RepID=UPI0010A50073|nr:26.5 kDa heat shock protein, mitochondrial-like [Prosopis alba]XP_028791597.1 26.5 kDa heat shock protein, mitochondrial-like [Prosopis alba]